MRLRFLFAILFFTWLIALLALTYYPGLPDMKIRVRNEWFRLDYLGHMGFYAALIVFFLVWQAGWRARIPGRFMFWTILGGLIFGAATEFSQLAIPGRFFNPIDMASNYAGILGGIAAVYALSRKVKR